MPFHVYFEKNVHLKFILPSYNGSYSFSYCIKMILASDFSTIPIIVVLVKKWRFFINVVICGNHPSFKKCLFQRSELN